MSKTKPLRRVYLVSVNNRLKAVKNIQKITKSMKIVSAAKFSKAEKELKPTRAYGEGTQGNLFLHKLYLQNNKEFTRTFSIFIVYMYVQRTLV